MSSNNNNNIVPSRIAHYILKINVVNLFACQLQICTCYVHVHEAGMPLCKLQACISPAIFEVFICVLCNTKQNPLIIYITSRQTVLKHRTAGSFRTMVLETLALFSPRWTGGWTKHLIFQCKYTLFYNDCKN